MRFSVYRPPSSGKRPVLWYLSGLTCTEENFTIKAGAQRYAADKGLMLVVPDTSPRQAGIEGEDDDYDLGSGAGFYLDATQPPWDRHYRMYSYLTQELPAVLFDGFDADPERQGICGHSMGGHGALTIGLKNPQVYHSISAFSPICSPMRCPWGHKAFSSYLGDDQDVWRNYDATALIERGARSGEMLVDQGKEDGFMETQLRPNLLKEICETVGQPLNLRLHAGYDHSYYFIASLIGDHIDFHAARLCD